MQTTDRPAPPPGDDPTRRDPNTIADLPEDILALLLQRYSCGHYGLSYDRETAKAVVALVDHQNLMIRNRALSVAADHHAVRTDPASPAKLVAGAAQIAEWLRPGSSTTPVVEQPDPETPKPHTDGVPTASPPPYVFPPPPHAFTFTTEDVDSSGMDGPL
jgi:hypothetical protein